MLSKPIGARPNITIIFEEKFRALLSKNGCVTFVTPSKRKVDICGLTFNVSALRWPRNEGSFYLFLEQFTRKVALTYLLLA